jgi:hypothetical protein
MFSKKGPIPAKAGIQEVLLLDTTGFRIRFGMDDQENDKQRECDLLCLD